MLALFFKAAVVSVAKIRSSLKSRRTSINDVMQIWIFLSLFPSHRHVSKFKDLRIIVPNCLTPFTYANTVAFLWTIPNLRTIYCIYFNYSSQEPYSVRYVRIDFCLVYFSLLFKHCWGWISFAYFAQRRRSSRAVFFFWQLWLRTVIETAGDNFLVISLNLISTKEPRIL